MNILALDPATKTGFAHSSGPSGVWDLRVKPDESSGMRLVRLQAKLNEIQTSLRIDLLVYESARNMKHGNAIRVAGELQGTIKLWCENHGIEYQGISPSTIKRHATGKGNASKAEMVIAAEIRWPTVVIDDNHADALWLLDWAIGEYAND